MVLEAEDTAKSWLVLCEAEREKYKRVAVAIAKRERASWSSWEAVERAFGSCLIFHSFFRDFELQDKYLDKIVVIIFEAVANEKEISDIAYKRDEEKFIQ